MDTVVFAIIKVTLIAVFGFFLYRRKIIKDESLGFLTAFVVNFAVPFLVFSRIIEGFQPGDGPSPWIFFVFSIGIFILGLIISGIFSFLAAPGIKREFFSLVAFSNCGYLPMNIALFLFSSLVRERFLIYVFFYIVGFNILMWSIGSFMLFKRKEDAFKAKTLLSPPVVAIVIALVLVYLNLARFIPAILLSPLKMIGETTFVLSMVILGAWLGKESLGLIRQRVREVIGVVILKLIVVPLVVFILVLKWKVFSLLGLFMVMEAAMPSAVSLPIVAHWYKREASFISQGVFITHLAGIITVPFWIELFLKVSGYSL